MNVQPESDPGSKPRRAPIYDVFLSCSAADIDDVEAIAIRLRDEAGIRPFFAKWHLVPGDSWLPALERAIEQSKTVAVFFGTHRVDTWHDKEKQLALVHAAAQKSRRVIPVLLQRAGEQDIKGFLRLRTWVELTESTGFSRLVAGIKGFAPELFIELDTTQVRAVARELGGKHESRDSVIDSEVSTALRETSKKIRLSAFSATATILLCAAAAILGYETGVPQSQPAEQASLEFAPLLHALARTTGDVGEARDTYITHRPADLQEYEKRISDLDRYISEFNAALSNARAYLRSSGFKNLRDRVHEEDLGSALQAAELLIAELNEESETRRPTPTSVEEIDTSWADVDADWRSKDNRFGYLYNQLEVVAEELDAAAFRELRAPGPICKR